MHRSKLTDVSIRGLAPPEKGNVVVWDEGIPGFGVRVSQGGAKSFFVLYGRERARHQIGRYGVISLADARHEARRFLSQRTLGRTEEEPSILFSDAVSQFLTLQDHLSEITLRDYSRLLKTRFAPKLGRKLVSAIQTADIAAILDGLSKTKAERKYAHSVIRRFFNWCFGRKYLKASPLLGLDVPKPARSRERVLSEDELRAVWIAAGNMGTYGKIVRLLILTGRRKSAIALMIGEWVNRDEQTVLWPSLSTEQKQPQLIPIGRMTLEIIPRGQGLLFPGRKKGRPIGDWRKKLIALTKGAGVKPFVLHDLRRTCTTMWAEMRIDRDVREFLVGHHVPGSKGVYDRWDRIPEMREAVVLWEERLAEIIRPDPSHRA